MSAPSVVLLIGLVDHDYGYWVHTHDSLKSAQRDLDTLTATLNEYQNYHEGDDDDDAPRPSDYLTLSGGEIELDHVTWAAIYVAPNGVTV